MHLSLLWRQHWKLVAAAGAAAAGFLLAAPVAALVTLAAGVLLFGAGRAAGAGRGPGQRPGECGLGEFGYLETGPGAPSGRDEG